MYEEEKELILLLEMEKNTIKKQYKCGIINEVDMANRIAMNNAQQQKLKEKLVLAVHVTAKGEPRKIEYKENTNTWKTMLPGKKAVTARTREGLIDKLFEHYHLRINGTTVEDVFNLALEEKRISENPSSNTLKRNKADYNRYITAEFGTKDVRNLTEKDLKAYTQELVNRMPLKKQAFINYKGILNMIFNYACSNGITAKNPVKAIKNSVYLKSCDISKGRVEDKIFTPAEIEQIKAQIRHYMTYTGRYNDGYFINGYAMLLSIEMGVRSGELVALRWSDVGEKTIWIHSQQLSHFAKGSNHREYELVNYTKNERGKSEEGRYFPKTKVIQSLLDEIKEKQTQLGIKSEFIFAKLDGDCIKTLSYETSLRRLCGSLGLSVTNNHAFRMSLNSNVFIAKLNLTAPERARLLGHSVETNLTRYTFAGKDNLDDICDLFDSLT